MKAISAVFAMFVGGMLYVSFRSESLAMFRWLDVTSLRDEVQMLRGFTASYIGIFPKWVYLTLPQALWYFSGLLAFQSIWGSGAATHRQRRAWMLIFSGLAIGLEIGQGFHWVPGSFDFLDLAFLLLAGIAAFAIGSFERRRLQGVHLEVHNV